MAQTLTWFDVPVLENWQPFRSRPQNSDATRINIITVKLHPATHTKSLQYKSIWLAKENKCYQGENALWAIRAQPRRLQDAPDLIDEVPDDVGVGHQRGPIITHNGCSDCERRHEPVPHHPPRLKTHHDQRVNRQNWAANWAILFGILRRWSYRGVVEHDVILRQVPLQDVFLQVFD